MNRVALGAALLALLGCGPERRHDSGQPTDLCTELPPLGDAEIFQIAGPRGESPCSGAAGELCLKIREYTLEEYTFEASTLMATGDVDGDGNVDAVLVETRETAGCGGRQYVRVLFGTPNGGLVEGPAVPALDSDADRLLSLLAVDDLSGDGRDEIVLASATSGVEETAYQLHLVGLDADRLVEHGTIDLGDVAPASLRTGNFDDRGLLDLYVDFEALCSGDDCGSCTPASVFFLDAFDEGSRRRVRVDGTTFWAYGGSLVARRPDGIDRIWTEFNDGDPCEAALSVSSLLLGEADRVVIEQTVDIAPSSRGMAADLDNDGASELFFSRYPDILFWSREREGDLYEFRQELPNRFAAGVVRLESVAEDAVFLVLGPSGNAPSGTELRRFDPDRRVFSEDADLTLSVDAWPGSSFRTRSMTAPPATLVLQVWKEDSSSALWVVSGRKEG